MPPIIRPIRTAGSLMSNGITSSPPSAVASILKAANRTSAASTAEPIA